MKVRLDEMTLFEVRELLKKTNVVLLPLGTTEQHGAHLPLKTDALHATYICENAAKKAMEESDVSVIVAPTIPYTDVAEFKMFPGSVGVKGDTLIRVIYDILETFLDQGFNNIIVLNSHLPNNCAMESAVRLVANEYPEANLWAVSSVYGLGFDAFPGLVEAGPEGLGHALETETAGVLYMEPQSVYLDRAVLGTRKFPISKRYIGSNGMDRTKGVLFYSGFTGSEESGIHGNPTMATREKGERLITQTISDLADIIIQVARREM